MTLNKQFDGLNYLFYKVHSIPLGFKISLSELFLFSYLESFRTSLESRCVITERAISVEALTEMPLSFPYHCF